MRIAVEDIQIELVLGNQELSLSSVELVDKLIELDQKADAAKATWAAATGGGEPPTPFDYAAELKTYLVSKGLADTTSITLVNLLLKQFQDNKLVEAIQKKMLGSPT